MKKLVKVLALALTVSLSFSMTALATELKVTTKSMSNAASLIIANYPTIDGMSELNERIIADMDFLAARFFTNHNSDFPALSHEIVYNGDLATITITPNIPIQSLVEPNTKVYFVDTVALEELTEAEFEERLAAASEGEATDEEQPVIEDITEETVHEIAIEVPVFEEVATYVNLRQSLSGLPINITWDDEHKAATFFFHDVYIGSIFVGDNMFYQYFSEEEYYETEMQLNVVNDNGSLQVGSDLIELLTSVSNALELLSSVVVSAE